MNSDAATQRIGATCPVAQRDNRPHNQNSGSFTPVYGAVSSEFDDNVKAEPGVRPRVSGRVPGRSGRSPPRVLNVAVGPDGTPASRCTNAIEALRGGRNETRDRPRVTQRRRMPRPVSA